MGGYTKLFQSILESTVWQETPPVKVVWITLLAMADRDGIIEASVPGLAKRAGVERPYCEQALALFLAPDPDSRTPDHEGRRIAVVPGGWRLLNYETYRERASKEEYAEKNAARQRRFQERKRSKALVSVTNVISNKSNDIAPTPSSAPAQSHSKELQVRTSADADYEAFHAAYPSSRRVGGKIGRQAFKTAMAGRRPEHLQVMLDALDQQKRSEQWQTPKLIPLMTTWLNQERWNQVLPEQPAVSLGKQSTRLLGMLDQLSDRR